MRQIVIAGSYAQYRDYLTLRKLHMKAAPYVHRGEQLAHFDPDQDEIVLVGTYRDNPAYQSSEYVNFVGQQCVTAIAV